jgi:transcriptional regulator with XRE-family HTH domain
VKSTDKLKKFKISETLEKIRKEKEMTPIDFSDLCGLTISKYRRMIRTNYSFEEDELRNLCEKIRIPYNAFLVRSLNTEQIKDEERKHFINNIKPIIDDIAKVLYSDDSFYQKHLKVKF